MFVSYWRILLLPLGVLSTVMLLGCAGPEVAPPVTPSPKADSLVKMGDMHLREGRYRVAMEQYMKAEEIDPQNPELKFRIALVYADYYKHLDDAVNYYTQAIQLKENYSEAYNNLGVIYLRQEKWDEAIEMFERALGNLFYRTPEKAYYSLGLAYKEKGENDKAIEHYQMAIELKSQSVPSPVYVELGLLYLARGEYERALQTFQGARSILDQGKPKKGRTPDDRWNAYVSSLAWVWSYEADSLVYLKRFPEAREAYQKALELTSDNALQRRVQEKLQSVPLP